MLDRLQKLDPKRKEHRRCGCGRRGGQGKTCGRGQKGAGARVGRKIPRGYEGGQIVLARRLPKRGFFNPHSQWVVALNLDVIGKNFKAGDVINEESLRLKNLVKVRQGEAKIKLLGRGEIGFPVTVRVSALSETARSKIILAGGAVEEI